MYLRLNTQVEYDGNNYDMPLNFLMSDLLLNKADPSNDYNINYTSDNPDGVDFSIALQRIISELGFNPFKDNKYYFANYQGNDLSDVDIFIKGAAAAMNASYFPRNNDTSRFKFTCNGVLLEGVNITIMETPGNIEASGQLVYFRSPNSLSYYFDGRYGLFEFRLEILPLRVYDHGVITPEYAGGSYTRTINYSIYYNTNTFKATRIIRRGSTQGSNYLDLFSLITSIEDYDDYVDDINPNNPYDTGDYSGAGGGDGSYGGTDVIEKTELPDIPNISAVSTGLITIFNPSQSQLNTLGGFLWSDLWDINTFKKLLASPLDSLIGLSIVPVNPTLGGSKTVKFGNIDTGVSLPYCSSQFVKKSMGSVTIKKDVGSFVDYDYTKVQIYLPYIGFRSLDVSDVMGEALTLEYNIDILTGGCSASIYVASKGVLYQFNGNCLANVPITSNNYSGAIQNAVSAATSAGAIIGGAVTGVAPLTAMGAASLAGTAANTAMNSKPSIERSGNISGAAGLMSVQTPYVVIERPRMSIPKKISEFTGNMANITMKLGNVTGFTMVDYIHLDNIPCTDNERSELLSLLKEGVIF